MKLLREKSLPWTEEEIEKLKELYPNTSNKDLVKILNRPYRGIQGKAFKLRLLKTEEHKKKE